MKKIMFIICTLMMLMFGACGVKSDNEKNADSALSQQTQENATETKAADEDTLSFEEIMALEKQEVGVACGGYYDSVQEYCNQSKTRGRSISLVEAEVVDASYYVSKSNDGFIIYDMIIRNTSDEYNDFGLVSGDKIRVHHGVGRCYIALKKGQDAIDLERDALEKIKRDEVEYYKIPLKKKYIESYVRAFDLDCETDIYLKTGEKYVFAFNSQIDFNGENAYMWELGGYPINEEMLKGQIAAQSTYYVKIGKQIIDLIEDEQKRD